MMGLLLRAFLVLGDQAVDRLREEQLQSLHEAVLRLRSAVCPVRLPSGYRDFRAVIHAHSKLSHDSRGTQAEILRAALAAGAQVVMMSEHPRPGTDVIAQGISGLRDGVLFIPGAESNQFLVYPRTKVSPDWGQSQQRLVDWIRKEGGQIFISHPEEQPDWTLSGITGMEIYNTHADLKDETRLLRLFSLGDRERLADLIRVLENMQRYPQEAFASIFDVPAENLRRWDALSVEGICVGVAANDAHNNTGFILKAGDSNAVIVEDPLGEEIARLEKSKLPGAIAASDSPPGTKLMEFRLDPYERSFRYVSTHILAPELSEEAIRRELARGRVYVAFDWMADPTGSAFLVEGKGVRATLGDEVPWKKGLQLRVALPLKAQVRLIRNGQEIARKEGADVSFPLSGKGACRIEAWLTLGNEQRPWIYTNHIRLK